MQGHSSKFIKEIIRTKMFYGENELVIALAEKKENKQTKQFDADSSYSAFEQNDK